MKRLPEMLFVLIALASLNGCAGMSAHMPKAIVNTNIPLFYSDVIKAYNSAGRGIIIVPQSQGDGFVAEYRLGKRQWYCLWLCKEEIPTRLVALSHGQSISLPLYRNTSDRTVYIPFAVKVIEGNEVIGFYNQCFAVPPYRNSNFDFNFGPRELAELKRGYTGYPCGGNGWW